MEDQALVNALLLLYSRDEAIGRRSAAATQLAESCRTEIAARMDIDARALGTFLTRLVRDAYLTEEAIEGGAGIEDACEFWTWFDQNMWPAERCSDRREPGASDHRAHPAPRGESPRGVT